MLAIDFRAASVCKARPVVASGDEGKKVACDVEFSIARYVRCETSSKRDATVTV